MATYVLVHGAWHGAWCWERFVPLLTAEGHTVVTPTLAGVGERMAELNRDTDLELHVSEVTASIDPAGPRDIILVGHSYGGMVVAAVGARRADRIAAIVYLDAFVPQDGQSLFDLAPPGRAEWFREQARLHGDGWRSPVPTAAAMGVIDENDARWLADRLTSHPISTMEQPVRFGADALDPALVPHIFIHCVSDPPSPTFQPFADRARSATGWTLFELATGHDAMITAPEELAHLLLMQAPVTA